MHEDGLAVRKVIVARPSMLISGILVPPGQFFPGIVDDAQRDAGLVGKRRWFFSCLRTTYTIIRPLSLLLDVFLKNEIKQT